MPKKMVVIPVEWRRPRENPPVLQVGDVVKKVSETQIEVERMVPFTLPTILGCVLLIERGNAAPIVVQDTSTLGKKQRRWSSALGMEYSDEEVLEFAERYGNLKTVYVPAM